MSRFANLLVFCAILALVAALPIASRQQINVPVVADIDPSPEASSEPLAPSPSPQVTGGSPLPSADAGTSSPTEPITIPGPVSVPSTASPPAGVQSSSVSQQLNEGCVAVEHLKGYVLQHPEHLMRPVLCAHNFCATPNHAIIVDGVMTSMKRLCANKWSCVKSVKLVNNLKILANSRAVISDRIVVTPYDYRFPKAAAFISQLVEDVWNRASNTIVLGVALIATIAAMSRPSKI